MSPLRNFLKIMFECGVKLEAKPETMALAAVYFHRFFKLKSFLHFDPNLISPTCVYLAAKVQEDDIKIRDIINVFHATINRSNVPLESNDHYWSLRDSIIQCELILLTVLKFQVNFLHPHRFLLHYLRSITEWLHLDRSLQNVFCSTCMALLNDYYLDPRCIENQPHSIALATIQAALEMLRIEVPYAEDALVTWNEALCENVSRDEIWKIVGQILSVYNEDEYETNLDPSPQEDAPDAQNRQYMPTKVIEYS